MNSKIPPYGWKVKLNHIFPEKRDQNFIPSFRIIFDLLTLIIRYLCYELWCYARGKKPVMDYIKVIQPKRMYGVPLGGIGGGTVGRGFKGEFCRFQLQPGIYEYKTVDCDQFIVTIRNKNKTVYQNVLSTSDPPVKGCLNGWKWNFPGENASYTGLYPRSWTEYDIPQCNIKLICRQISPVIPNNYKDSCLPGGVFVWTVENNSSESLSVTITFCLSGYKDATGGEPFQIERSNVKIAGMKIHNNIRGMKCTFAFGAKETNDVVVTSKTFNPNGTGTVVWDALMEKGYFEEKLEDTIQFYNDIACAVAGQINVDARSSKDIEFALVWHMPFIQFFNKQLTYERFYTKFYGNDSDADANMCAYALLQYVNWETEIDLWQNPILNDERLPDWYKSAIFNELYYISDGGSVWVQLHENERQSLSASDPRREFGKFAYLEGHEYRMYNTYDVHFYASFALAHLWPKLQFTIQYEFRDSVTKTDTSLRWFLYDGRFGRRKDTNCIPHDIGDPEEEPFAKINSYPVHNVTHWKDLNLKFVLQCYRDYVFTNEHTYLVDMWPQIKLLMNYCLEWDTDGDGMIENSNFPDQTYDAWSMTGVSAYCGGLWLAALCMTVKMASIVNDVETKNKFADVLEKAKKVYNDKLWNGSYYDFDTGRDSKSIMADQLCGLWYLEACDVTDKILPDENVKKALSTVYNFNVLRFKNGESGAVNGMLPNGDIDTESVQSQECWTGVTYALASHLLFRDMTEEGFQTAKGIYETVYNRIGMAYDTPEALYESKYIRAIAYMRPLSIWSIQIALGRAKRRNV